ncbi:MAG: Fimbrial protein pilin [Parcubacteria group bacterium GW2011_GWC2_45_7]|nr:MAG: Fimbrial protein pilin [Parcubacteria group bacterium GW2011_GWC2_45_7]
MKHKIKNAFTLLELMVVIGIIAILVALGATSYSTAQKKARDSRRQSDLSTAQKTLEQCYSVNNFEYPDVSVSSGTISATCPAPNDSITFSIIDPLNSGTYVYALTESTPVGTTYSITADLETSTTDASVTQQQ